MPALTQNQMKVIESARERCEVAQKAGDDDAFACACVDYATALDKASLRYEGEPKYTGCA